MGRCPSCPLHVYAVMRKCWSLVPEYRPSFATLVKILTQETPASLISISSGEAPCETSPDKLDTASLRAASMPRGSLSEPVRKGKPTMYEYDDHESGLSSAQFNSSVTHSAIDINGYLIPMAKISKAGVPESADLSPADIVGPNDPETLRAAATIAGDGDTTVSGRSSISGTPFYSIAPGGELVSVSVL